MATEIKIESADDVALASLLDRHAELRREVDEGVGRLRKAIAGSRPHVEPLAELVSCIRSSVLPLLAAEEDKLYPLLSDDDRLHLLVAAMVVEHRDLEWRSGALNAALAGARLPTDALGLAEGFAAVLGVHLAKEAEYLLPALADVPDVSLTDLVRQLEGSVLEHRARPAGASDAVETLDVRELRHGDRHEFIFGRLGELAVGEVLLLVNDHDPKPLHYQLDAAWPATYGWEYRQSGPQLWQIAITRLRVS
jgi:uncharacterized protein (DUF2249 family)